jgi:dTDP-4-amino-4,6-dideoxygalactose transaminase
LIPYGAQDISSFDIEMVGKALEEDLLTTGNFVVNFEKQLSEFVGANTFVVNSGTAALHAAYYGAGIKDGDEVITPPNTFIATQATASMLGAKVVFADIDISTGLMNLEAAAAAITERTKAVVVVDYAGQPCDLEKFQTLVAKYGILLIEDAAHSLGSVYKGKPIGSVCDFTTFSFFPTKNITTGEGGAVSSKNHNLLQKARTFSRQGLVRNPEEFLLTPDGPWHQEVHDFGLNYRLTDFQCALGMSQLSRIHELKAKRAALVERYRQNLSKIDSVSYIKQESYCDPMWHLFPLLVPKDVRHDLFIHLRKSGIGVQVNYFPAHAHPVFQQIGYQYSDYPGAVEFYEREISLPLHTKLEVEKVDWICEEIIKFINRY